MTLTSLEPNSGMCTSLAVDVEGWESVSSSARELMRVKRKAADSAVARFRSPSDGVG